MKKRLIVISAGDFGREVANGVRRRPPAGADWEFAGFLDDRPGILDAYPCEGPILGGVRDYAIRHHDRFLCAIGDPADRLKYAGVIEERGGHFTTFVSGSALVGDRCELGMGAIICENVEITTDIQIGRHACVMSKCLIGHNAEVGDGTVISAFSFLGGHARVGRACFLGPHAVILPKARVGDGCRVGAASVVLRSAPPNTTVFGNPAVVVAQHGGA